MAADLLSSEHRAPRLSSEWAVKQIPLSRYWGGLRATDHGSRDANQPRQLRLQHPNLPREGRVQERRVQEGRAQERRGLSGPSGPAPRDLPQGKPAPPEETRTCLGRGGFR